MYLLPLYVHGAEYTDEDGITWYYATPLVDGIYPYPETALITESSRIPYSFRRSSPRSPLTYSSSGSSKGSFSHGDDKYF